MTDTERLIEIFNHARTRPTGPERDRIVVEACGSNQILKQQVESLLQAELDAGDFLQNSSFPRVITERPGDMIGPYKLRELLGEGGCGVVYLADQDVPIRRRVALKVIKLGMDTRAVVSRFEAERQALAMMDHPNIARVFDAGATQTGRPYFVMELVRGTPITEYCDRTGISTRERLNLFIQVCHAIQHAHQKGVIHRDIKPSNILVTLQDGVAIPKVIDFGIAKATEGRLSQATIYTQLHQWLGTPAYMSPEQLEMSGLDIDTRSDIYSLGVLLYELLAGTTPFDPRELLSQGLVAMRKTICEREPIPPSTKLAQLGHEDRSRAAQLRATEPPRLIHLVRGDLDWIVMKCLEKDRTRRYESASGLAADLKRHLRCEPIQARPPSTAYRLQKTFRRHKLSFSAAAAVALSLVLGLIASLWQNVKANRAQREAERKSYVYKMNLARQAWDDNNMARLRELLAETENDPHRGFEWYYWQRQSHLESLTLRGHLAPVVHAAYSPDGSRIVTASFDRTVRIWNAGNGLVERILKGHDDPVTSAAWSADGHFIVTASFDHTAKVWDAVTGGALVTFRGHGKALNSARFLPMAAGFSLARSIAPPGFGIRKRARSCASFRTRASSPPLPSRPTELGLSPQLQRISSRFGRSTVGNSCASTCQPAGPKLGAWRTPILRFPPASPPMANPSSPPVRIKPPVFGTQPRAASASPCRKTLIGCHRASATSPRLLPSPGTVGKWSSGGSTAQPAFGI